MNRLEHVRLEFFFKAGWRAILQGTKVYGDFPIDNFTHEVGIVWVGRESGRLGAEIGSHINHIAWSTLDKVEGRLNEVSWDFGNLRL